MRKSNDVCIHIQNLSVIYNSPRYKFHTLKEFLFNKLKGMSGSETFAALKDINLDIYKGESVALIGHNGSGKSTLLRCIAGILQPKNSIVNVAGRIAPMIELSAGFDGELSGRENIRLSSTLMGLSEREIDERMDDIIHFSELSNFIDVPFKNYSSGMQARLGFACVTSVDPDVLLIDEVLSVGDSNFSRKCLARIGELRRKGATIVLVSHDPATVTTFCDKGFVFEHGELKYAGEIKAALKKHDEIMEMRFFEQMSEDEKHQRLRLQKLAQNEQAVRNGINDPLPSVRTQVSLWQGKSEVNSLDFGKEFSIHLNLDIQNAASFNSDVSVGLGFNHAASGVRIGGVNNLHKSINIPLEELRAAKFLQLIYDFGKGIPELAEGAFDLIVGVHDENISRTVFVEKILTFKAHNSLLGFNSDMDLISIQKYVSDFTCHFRS